MLLNLPKDIINEILSYFDLHSIINLCDTCKYLNLLSKLNIDKFKLNWDKNFEIETIANGSYEYDLKIDNKIIGNIYSYTGFLYLDDTQWKFNTKKEIKNWLKNNIKIINKLCVNSNIINYIRGHGTDYLLSFYSIETDEKICILKYLYYFATTYKIEDKIY